MTVETLSPATEELGEDVRDGLLREGQKVLPTKYLYDDVGSALFEAITKLPEYGLTRAEERNLARCAGEVAESCRQDIVVAELGSGSGRKTRLILDALARSRAGFEYHAIDVSAEALAQCGREMSAIEGLVFRGEEATYLEGLRKVARERSSGAQLLLLFLGSTLGNMDSEVAERFLADARALLDEKDLFFFGADMVKDESELLLAYDDPAGVTSAFNLNLLRRINHELGHSFDLKHFEHHVRYDRALQRVEMHLRSLRDQEVRIESLDLTVSFREGETIHTESSHKFLPEDLKRLAAESGFEPLQVWCDEQWAFCDSLWAAN